MCMYCVLCDTQEAKCQDNTLPETRYCMLSELLDGHEHMCVYPLIADPQWNRTPSPSFALPDTYWPETPCRCEARILTCLSQRVPYLPVRPWSINIHTLYSGIFCSFVSCTFYNKHIVSDDYSAKFSPLFLKRPISFSHDIVWLGGVFELASLIGWPYDMSLVCRWNFSKTTWSDCWGCGPKARI